MFSYEQTISLLNNAANELTRAARDFGDDRPDGDPLTVKMHDLTRQIGDVLADLEAEREIAANGPQPSSAARAIAALGEPVDVTLRDVQQSVTPRASTDPAVIASNQPAVAPVIDTSTPPADPKPASVKAPKPADSAAS